MKKRILAIIAIAALISTGASCRKDAGASGRTKQEVAGSSKASSSKTQSKSSKASSSQAPSSSAAPSSSVAPSSTAAPSSSAAPSSQAPSSSVQPSQTAAPVEPVHIDGGWQLNLDGPTPVINDDALDAFYEATPNLMGADYSPIAILGTQVVAGTNYAFLCRQVVISANPVPKLCVVIVYEDLRGNAQITNVTDFDLGSYWGNDNTSQQSRIAAGGWSLPDDFTTINLPRPVSSVFMALAAWDPGLQTMAYLGSQVVAGTNYAVLCYDTDNGPAVPCIMYMYAPINGSPELTNIYYINVGDYNR
ncbi:MAG: hypothetical protein IK152_05760 [Lachnospiraceae bacterium]|nr:hypothetical protein [Lachnospiraceae bacterium]